MTRFLIRLPERLSPDQEKELSRINQRIEHIRVFGQPLDARNPIVKRLERKAPHAI